MKIILLLFSTLFCSQTSVFAIGHSTSDSILLLHAAKDNHLTKYVPGNFLKIFYITDSSIHKTKGSLLKVSKDSIDILPFDKRATIERIAISKITAVEKLHRNGRKAVLGLQPDSALLILYGLLAVGAIFFFIILQVFICMLLLLSSFLLLSFLSDFLSKKSVTKGWRFYSGKGTVKIHHNPAISPYRPLL